MINQVIPASGNMALSCNCRLPPPPAGQIHDLLQKWITDHPYHTRKEHILAHSLFQWLERQSNGGCA